MEIEPGTRIAGYAVESPIGRGGMGVVYRATQVGLGRSVALKVIASELAEDEAFRARFERECRLAASLDDPHVITIHEAGEDGGRLFVAMRLVEGPDLRSLVARQGPLPAERAADVIDQIAGALDAAHSAGLVHRDVKPANILIESRRGGEYAYLSDFGLVKRLGAGSELTATGQWIGTVDYAAPEQISGEQAEARSDVYALGGVLYYALSGEVPFPRPEGVAKLYAHLKDDPPVASATRPELPAELDAVIARAMSKLPDGRFPSAGDLGRAATAAVAGRAVTVPERSVATGEAATVPMEPRAGVAQGRTATAPTAPLEAESPDAAAGGPTRRRRAGTLAAGLLAGALLAVAILALTGAFSDGAREPARTGTATGSGDAVATVSATPSVNGTEYPMELSVFPLERQGDLLLLRMSLEVKGGDGYLMTELGQGAGDYDASGIQLLAGGEIYEVLKNGDDECVCTKFSTLDPGTYNVNATFPAPAADVTEATVAFPGLFDTVSSVPIT